MRNLLPAVVLAALAACTGCGASRVDARPPAPASTAPEAPPPEPPDTFDVRAIDQYIARQMASRRFVGLSVALVKDGEIVLERGYGKSHLLPDASVQPDTPFSIGSITKQFVSSVILLLAEEKKLSLDDKVAKYFPDLTRANDITLYDLMTHVSGYPDTYPLDFVDEEMKKQVTPDEIIARYAKRPLDFEPRTRWSYTGTGYMILGRVIEKVTGKPLGVVLDERIFRPIGMSHTLYLPKEASPELAWGYTSFALGPPEPAEPEAHEWNYGAGGIYAPAGDLAKWDIALMSGNVLGPVPYKTLTTPRRLADGRLTSYGCGIGTGTWGGEEVLEHGGGSSGFVSYNVLIPRTRSAVVVLSNRDDADPERLASEIVPLLNKTHRPSPLHVAGPDAKAVAGELFAKIQSGQVDRGRFGPDFNAFLTDEKLQRASARLRPLGVPTKVDVEGTHERGGMEQATVRFTFGTTKVKVVMFRSVDGKVQQFLIYDL